MKSKPQIVFLFATLLLSLNMLVGRLEVYTVVILLTPMFWRRT